MKQSFLQKIVPVQAKRIVVGIVGMTLLALGLVLIVAPGPATVVLPLALAILATEFAWARRWLRKLKALADGHTPKSAPSRDDERDKDEGEPCLERRKSSEE